MKQEEHSNQDRQEGNLFFVVVFCVMWTEKEVKIDGSMEIVGR